MRLIKSFLGCLFAWLSCSFGQSTAQEFVLDTADCLPVHNLGKLVVTRPVCLVIGEGAGGLTDCFLNEYPPSSGAAYPKGANLSYLNSVSYWIGGILEKDSLVTQGDVAEYYLNFEYELRSKLAPSSPNFNDAISELDYVQTTLDNCCLPPSSYNHYDTRPHKPLNISVTSSSYSWSYEYAEDFVLFDVAVRNIGEETIRDTYFGAQYLSKVGFEGSPDRLWEDDVGGFLKWSSLPSACGLVDTLNFLWGADNDGDPINGVFTGQVGIDDEGRAVKSCTSVTGMFFLNQYGSYGDRQNISYNWWATNDLLNYDYGPQQRDKIRDFGTGGTGFPFGDNNRYYVMTNGEIDFDQIFTYSVTQFDPIWLYPPQEEALDISNGGAVIHLLSIGPYTLEPGDEVHIPFAYVAGENFHTDPNNGSNLPNFPKQYYAKLDFSDLVANAQWARWVYDNPGVDTDDDGYFGEYHICTIDSQFIDGFWVITAADTIWYRGDGVPDWKAAGPPPAPEVWLEPLLNGVRVRFNGSRSETELDIFTRIPDFEGYRVYIGRDERVSSYSLVASYDKENFDKYVWNPAIESGVYELRSIPFSIDSLRCLYGRGDDPCGDSTFQPLNYRRTFPYQHPDFPDSLFYFLEHDHNTSELGISTPIRKVYPDAPDPRGVPLDSLTDDYIAPNGGFKFFEYECVIENLLPTVPYWVNVTAFDFGSPKSKLRALETSVTINAKSAYVLNGSESGDGNLNVYVYPNPYRIDADYRDLGYEGRTQEDRPDHRVMAIHFANLPPKCSISIFSLDGDLVRKLDHDIPASDPNHRHHTWDLITRNTQLVVSGLYYWVVESNDGQTQIGKLVIIL